MQPAELSLSSLLSVYNELTPEKPLKAFKDKPTAVARVAKRLEETGKSLMAAEAPAEGGAKYVVVSPIDSVQPSRETPGLRRMQENLGAEGAESLRQTVVQEQDQALAEAALRGAPQTPEQRRMGKFSGALKTSATEPSIPKKRGPKPQPKEHEEKKTKPREERANKARDRAKPLREGEVPPPRKGRQAAIADTAKIYVLAATNPKRGDCHRRFALYGECETVADYIAKVGDRRLGLADVRWDSSKGWIKVV